MADLRQSTHSMLGQNNHLKNSDTEKHFLQGFKRRTIYDIIKRYEISLLAEDLPRDDHPTFFNAKKL